MMIDTFKHLLPRARAWRITVDKFLRQFFSGLSVAVGDATKEYIDNVWSDIDPQLTRELSVWESEFGLRNTDITEQERRDRLEAAWAATGGQSIGYIQGVLQANGFNVIIHDWWVPGSEPAVGVDAQATARDPFNVSSPDAVPLVNNIYIAQDVVISESGATFMESGDDEAESGNFRFVEGKQGYVFPTDTDLWPYIIYIGGTAGAGEVINHASVPAARQEEFEDLCLKLCPRHLWIGLVINYI